MVFLSAKCVEKAGESTVLNENSGTINLRACSSSPTEPQLTLYCWALQPLCNVPYKPNLGKSLCSI